MEALAAVGLATSVIQFVDFSLKIYSKTVQIASSVNGISDLNSELQKYCLSLEEFSSKLSPIGPVVVPNDSFLSLDLDDLARRHENAIREHVEGVEKIAGECTKICHELLVILKKLHRASSPNRPRPLIVAVKEHFKSKSIAQRETKLKDLQSSLNLHLSGLLNERQKYMMHLLRRLASMHSSTHFKQTERHNDIKTQLETLSRNIRDLVTRLRNPNTRQTSLQNNDVDCLERMLCDLQLSEKNVGDAAEEQKIIQSLDFAEKKLRHETIKEAHKNTFGWVLKHRDEFQHDPETTTDHDSETTTDYDSEATTDYDSEATTDYDSETTTDHDPETTTDHDPETTTDHDPETTRSYKGGDFTQWLQSGRGVFWVTGKPGSGKSTLMKFIADHKKTKAVLKSWAGRRRLITASHYFWAIGTDKQKSQMGLLQKMLFDILCRCPQLAWDIFPDRYRQGTGNSGGASFDLPYGDGWSIKELHKALKLLKGTAVPAKFCFFIDGLDEYSGDHIELCDALKALVKSENIKCCVSSRPWNVFVDAFGEGESAPLRIHDFTRNDIDTFARDRLAGIPGKKDRSVNESSIRDLARLVTERAEGVFLWVFLVTNELRNGIANSSTMAELSKLLKSLPTELGAYFKHTIDRIPKQHHRCMAKTFQIALSSTRVHLKIYQFYEYNEDSLDLPMSMPGSDKKSAKALTSHGDLCKRRINDRCAGLLSFSKNNYAGFIHRTVHAYLMTGPVQNYLTEKIGTAFLPKLAIFWSMLFRFRFELSVFAKSSSSGSNSEVVSCWKRCLKYVNEAMEEDREATIRLLDCASTFQCNTSSKAHAAKAQAKLDRFVRQFTVYLKPAKTQSSADSESVSLTNGDHDNIAKVNLKAIFLRFKLSFYVMDKLSDDINYFRSDGIFALASTIKGLSYISDETENKLVIALLEKGFDPNESIEGDDYGSPWELFLSRLDSVAENLPLLFAFLKHGADMRCLSQWLTAENDRPRASLARFIREARNIDETCWDLLRGVFADLLGSSKEKNFLVLKHMTAFSTYVEKFPNPKDIQSLQASAMQPDNKAIHDIISFLTIEMIKAELAEEDFMKWHSFWKDLLAAYCPRAERMANEFISVFLRKRSRIEAGPDDGESSKRQRTDAEA